jgi:PAS domain S-box-containing protein
MMNNNDHTRKPEGAFSLASVSELHRTLFEEAVDSMFITDQQGRLLAVNSRTIELIGYTEEELLGMDFTALVYPEDLVREPIFPGDCAQGKAVIKEHRFLRKDGSLVWVENRMRVLTEGTLLGINIDITERKRSEKALREREEMFSMAFSASPAPLAISDMKTGRFIDVNEQWLRMLEYTREETIGHTPDELKIWENPDSSVVLGEKL